MKIIAKSLIIGMILFSSAIPVNAQNWYKGNLHTHSLWSDGDDYPEMIADWYKSNGYNFLGFSEHNKLQEGPAWKNHNNKEARSAFEKYLSKFGSKIEYYDWGNGINAARLMPLDEYRNLFEEKEKFLLIHNEEITSNFNTRPIHMVATNIKYVLPGQYAKTKTGIIQETVNKVAEQRKLTGQKMIVQLCHPNFGYSLTTQDILPVKDLRFFEVFNGAPATNSYGNALNESTEVIWDKVNLSRSKEGIPLLLGVGVDDAHNYHETKPDLNNTGRAWIVVNAPKLDQESIVEAMEAGKFYTSTGVVLESLSFGSKLISLKVKKIAGVTYKIQFIGAKKGKNSSEVLKEVAGTDAEYVLKNDDLFVRAKIISSKLRQNVDPVGDFEKGWTQPVTQNTNAGN